MNGGRAYHQIFAGRFGFALVVLAICIFVFGILGGVAESDHRNARHLWGMGIGLAAALAFPWVARACRREFEAAGTPPERAARGAGAMVAIAGMVMFFCGLGGLFYVVSPAELAGHIQALRLPPLSRDRELAIASSVYALAGVLLIGYGLSRGRRTGWE